MKRGFFGGAAGSESVDFGGQAGVGVFGNTLASLFYRLNYMKLYEHQFVEIYNQVDIVNGLVLRADAGYYQRSLLNNHSDFAFFKYDNRSYTLNSPPVDSSELSQIKKHNTTLISLGLSYTPEHYYQIRDDRKYMLTSRFPTFNIQCRTGFPDIGKSEIKFFNFEGGIEQTIRSGPGNKFSYQLIYGNFLSQKDLNFIDYKHFKTPLLPFIIGDFSKSYNFLEYYKYSTNSYYAQAFIKYQSSYLALKYLPWLSNRIWNENIYFSVLYTNKVQPYWETGYTMTNIGVVFGAGFFIGFNKLNFHMIGLKFSLSLRGDYRL